MKSLPFSRLIIFTFLISISFFSTAQQFVHPGINQTSPDLALMKKMVLNGEQPYKDAFDRLKAAAENEGQALLITKTKAAEAEGNAIKIAAEAERQAAQLRGQGVALFREEVARGMSQAAEQMKQANLDTNVILFSMWTEAIKNFAEVGKGNVIFLDGSSDGMQHTMQQIMALMKSPVGVKENGR